jgi:hypothetical protein
MSYLYGVVLAVVLIAAIMAWALCATSKESDRWVEKNRSNDLSEN